MSIKDQYKILEFGDLGDERGKLVVVEGAMDIPFEIKRVFYIYGSDSSVIRGQHANRDSEFVLINVSGSSKVRVDNGFEEEIIELNRPRMGLYLPTMVWKDMYDFSEDSVLLVLASVVLTGLNLFGRIARWGGAGALVPITGFANSVAAPAIEYQKEGQVFGIGCKIFTIAGPVILYGTVASWLLGLIYWVLKTIGI